MPVYEFQCDDCGYVADRYFKMDVCPDAGGCSRCDGTARKVMSAHFIKSDEPAWLNNHVRDVLQKPGEPPIVTRRQHDDYLKRNNYVQVG